MYRLESGRSVRPLLARWRTNTRSTPEMNTTQRTGIMQRWHVLQYDLLLELKNEVGVLRPKLEQVIHTLECVRIDH